jgi:hypothetical protein
MNTWQWMMTLGTAGALVAACTTTTPSDDDSNSDGGSGGTAVTAPASGPGSGPASTTAPASTSTMAAGGICGSELSTGSEGRDACLTASCCDSFNACVADNDCQACLTNAMAPGCDQNTLLDAFDACETANCRTDVCDDGITFSDGNGDPAFACISCASDDANGCCASLDLCVGAGDQAGVTDCLTCLNDDAINTNPPAAPTAGACFDLGATIYDNAVLFQQCIIDNCTAECGF